MELIKEKIMMLKRLKSTKTLKLFIGTLLATLTGMFLMPEEHAMHLALPDGVQILMANFAMLFLRDGMAK